MPKTKFPAFPTAIDTDWRLLSQNLGLQALLVVKAVFAVFRPQADSLAKSKSEGKQVKNKRSIEGAGTYHDVYNYNVYICVKIMSLGH